MAFTDIPLRRSIPAGIAAYAIQYGLMLIIVSGRIGSFSQTTTFEYESIGPRTLADALEAPPPPFQQPTVGPALASTLFIGGGAYPLVFGFLGGRLARFVAD